MWACGQLPARRADEPAVCWGRGRPRPGTSESRGPWGRGVAEVAGADARGAGRAWALPPEGVSYAQPPPVPSGSLLPAQFWDLGLLRLIFPESRPVTSVLGGHRGHLGWGLRTGLTPRVAGIGRESVAPPTLQNLRPRGTNTWNRAVAAVRSPAPVRWGRRSWSCRVVQGVSPGGSRPGGPRGQQLGPWARGPVPATAGVGGGPAGGGRGEAGLGALHPPPKAHPAPRPGQDTPSRSQVTPGNVGTLESGSQGGSSNPRDTGVLLSVWGSHRPRPTARRGRQRRCKCSSVAGRWVSRRVVWGPAGVGSGSCGFCTSDIVPNRLSLGVTSPGRAAGPPPRPRPP